ncbi:hypothetical protein scyTo_0007930, partial [Scyliorhinus torazame]|nr:hypothetical protein [Scyliorhinus torazame]
MENPETELKSRNPVPVQITVLRARNLKGSKGDNPVTYVHAEYNNFQLGDSGKLQMAENEIEYNFTTSFDCTFDGIHGLDNLVHKPVVLTVIEVLPKEKKKKDEKVVVLGQATVDLLPLAQGECTFTKTLILYPFGNPLEQIVTEETQALLDISVSVAEPLLSEAQLKESNLLRITAESVYSKHIAESIYSPVEIKRQPLALPAKAGGKTSKTEKTEEEGPVSFHGVAYVNMAPLLYPGVKRIRGAYTIHPYNEFEIFEKTKRKNRDVAGVSTGLKGPSTHPRNATNKVKEVLKKNSVTLKSIMTDHVFDSEVPFVVNAEGEQYIEAKSYIVLEFSLEKPLVQKRLREELVKRVAEIIPPRPLFPRRTSGADKAVTDYHTQIISVAKIIMDEYQEMFGRKLAEGKLSQELQDQEERKHKLIFELNTSGKYFAFKEQLK